MSYLSQLLQMDESEIDTSASFEVYGLDSTAAAGMSGDLEQWLGRPFDAKLAKDYPTIDAMTEYLVRQMATLS